MGSACRPPNPFPDPSYKILHPPPPTPLISTVNVDARGGEGVLDPPLDLTVYLAGEKASKLWNREQIMALSKPSAGMGVRTKLKNMQHPSFVVYL